MRRENGVQGGMRETRLRAPEGDRHAVTAGRAGPASWRCLSSPATVRTSLQARSARAVRSTTVRRTASPGVGSHATSPIAANAPRAQRVGTAPFGRLMASAAELEAPELENAPETVRTAGNRTRGLSRGLNLPAGLGSEALSSAQMYAQTAFPPSGWPVVVCARCRMHPACCER
jgi:hypothetical protein